MFNTFWLHFPFFPLSKSCLPAMRRMRNVATRTHCHCPAHFMSSAYRTRDCQLPTASLIKNKTHHLRLPGSNWLFALGHALYVRKPEAGKEESRESWESGESWEKQHPQHLTHRISCGGQHPELLVHFVGQKQIIEESTSTDCHCWGQLGTLSFHLFLSPGYFGGLFRFLFFFVIYGFWALWRMSMLGWLCHKMKYEYVRK